MLLKSHTIETSQKKKRNKRNNRTVNKSMSAKLIHGIAETTLL
jgi:hypothetical protein